MLFITLLNWLLMLPGCSQWSLVPAAVLYGYALLYSIYFPSSSPPVSLSSAGDFTLANLATLFSVKEITAAGWAHFIAFDFFVGRWVYLDSVKNRVFSTHSLLLTAFLGPLARDDAWPVPSSLSFFLLAFGPGVNALDVCAQGLLSHLLTRAIYARLRGEQLPDSISQDLDQ